MVYAYVLIRADAGAEREVLESLLDLDEVEEVELIYGEWDLIAKINIDDLEKLSDFLLLTIRTIKGVKQTSTLIVS
ncbi:MAG: Lrp/AsnC ligand binding domain-containing protein [Candidatus Nanoarchaeia archaeon]